MHFFSEQLWNEHSPLAKYVGLPSLCVCVDVCVCVCVNNVDMKQTVVNVQADNWMVSLMVSYSIGFIYL